MTSELVERLSDDTAPRTAYEAGGYVNWDRQPDEKKDRHRRIAAAVLGQAADRIEALEAENARLRGALEACFSNAVLFNRDTDAAWIEVRDMCRAALNRSQADE